MTVGELQTILAAYSPQALVTVYIDAWELPLKGHTTFHWRKPDGPGYDDTKPPRVALFVQDKVSLSVLTAQELRWLQQQRERTNDDPRDMSVPKDDIKRGPYPSAATPPEL